MINDFIEVKSRLRRRRVLKMAYNLAAGTDTKIPAIRFSGSYLEDLGFMVNGKYEITINDDKSITLRPVEENIDVQES